MNYTLKKTHLKDTQADIETDRNSYIGCSDIGTIMGANPWKSAYTLWCEKTGRIQVPDISNKPAIWWGREEEALVAKYFMKETGIKVKRSNYRYYLEEMPYFSGHVDRLLADKSAGLEIKTTSAHAKTNYAEGDIPDSHYWQCQGYMCLTGLDSWYIATKQDQQVYIGKVDRNDEDIEKMLTKISTFWDCVQRDIAPMPDGSESTSKTLDIIYTPSIPQKTYLSEDDDIALAQLMTLKERQKHLKGEIDALENSIKEEMGECENAESEGYIVTWKSYSADRFDSKRFKAEHPDLYADYINTSVSRRFNVKERNSK